MTRVAISASNFSGPDLFQAHCPVCKEFGRTWPSRWRAVQDCVEHDLPGGCKLRQLESWIALGIMPVAGFVSVSPEAMEAVTGREHRTNRI
jgi:hypothetical protein